MKTKVKAKIKAKAPGKVRVTPSLKLARHRPVWFLNKLAQVIFREWEGTGTPPAPEEVMWVEVAAASEDTCEGRLRNRPTLLRNPIHAIVDKGFHLGSLVRFKPSDVVAVR